MKKWFIIGAAAAAVMLAVSVYALQGKVTTRDPASLDSANLQKADCSGCVTSSGCDSTSGGCGRTASSPEQVQSRLEKIEAYMFEYYTKGQGLADITVEVESFGCHEEATVKQAGQIIGRFSINGGTISPIEG
jgi:hypothetical protein